MTKNSAIKIASTYGGTLASESDLTVEERIDFEFRFTLIIPFIDSIDHVFVYGFSEESSKKPFYKIVNAGLAINGELIGGTYPNLRINYHNLQVSEGLLTPPNAAIYLHKKVIARLEWNKEDIGRGRKGDKIYWMQYNATTNYTEVHEEINRRLRGYCDIKLHPTMLNDELHYWIFFTSPNRNQRSNSVYLGQLNTSFYTPIYHVDPPEPQVKKAKPIEETLN